MNDLFRFFVQYELPIYLILGIGALFSLRSLLKAWADWRLAVFGLEKELVFQRVRVSGAFFILFLMIGLSQFCLVTFVVPFLPAVTFLATPTVDLNQPPVGPTADGTLAAEITATPAPPPGSVGCVPGQLIILSPLPGAEVQGKIVLQGSVDIPNLGFYKYEYATQGSEQWKTIAAGDKIIQNGELGQWDTTELVPGDYQLRLLVTDNVGAALPPCVLPVRIIAPAP